MSEYRFRPRYRGVAWTSIGIGGSLAAISATIGFIVVPLVSGIAGIAAGVAYLASPTWRIVVTVTDKGLEVGSPNRKRFTLAWSDVVKVTAASSSKTCFVDGGAPEKSLLVPGRGAPASYDIDNKAALYEAILANVAADKIEHVESLDKT